jgi:hypothetical protein
MRLRRLGPLGARLRGAEGADLVELDVGRHEENARAVGGPPQLRDLRVMRLARGDEQQHRERNKTTHLIGLTLSAAIRLARRKRQCRGGRSDAPRRGLMRHPRSPRSAFMKDAAERCPASFRSEGEIRTSEGR